MERLKQTYSPEILTVMKMSNIDGLKQHYRCHKDKRAKTIKTMASVTDPARMARLHSCLDKRMEFLDERGVEDAVDEVEDVAATTILKTEEAPDYEPTPPPTKQLRLEDFKEAHTAGGSASRPGAEASVEEYDANRIYPGEQMDDEELDDAFLDDFVPKSGAAASSAAKADKVHHFFEFLKAEVRELPKARQLMLMDSFFIQLTEARKWK